MRPIHIFLILSAVALLAGLYKTFEKAGEKGWKALVPVYNFLVWLRIIQKPWWWIFLVLIPTVGFYMLAIMIVLLSNCFGKRKFTDHVIAVLAYFIWVPYLGFSKDVKWQGVPPEEKKRHWLKEWGEAAVFAVVAATLIRTFFFEAFVIPSSSMEGTLLVGDYLFVSKMSYGAKVPAIPLTIPFTHNTIPGTETTRSYLDWVELPELRLPAFGDVERNDIVVFNFPEGDTVWKGDRNRSYYQHVRSQARETGMSPDVIRQQLINNEEIVTHPVDKEDNYVKRCVAIPGDLLEIRDKQIYINGKASPAPKGAQWSYAFNIPPVTSEEQYQMWKAQFAAAGVTDDFGPADDSGYAVPVHTDELAAFKKIVGNVRPNLRPKGLPEPDVFPHRVDLYPWNRDNFGPLKIPAEGMTVNLTPDSLPFWERIIRVYEGNTLSVKGDQVFVNGAPAKTYTFKQDYFFMMGDNRHNSLDSRYWGFVPASHIVGKPVFVWMSKGDHDGFRPDRMMTFVSRDGLSRSYLWRVLGGIAAVVVYNQLKRKKKDDGTTKKPLTAKKK